MKKYGKLLCSILVVAILASSLAFVVGAAEEDAFTPSFEVKKFNGDAISDGLKLAGFFMRLTFRLQQPNASRERMIPRIRRISVSVKLREKILT